MTDRDFPNSRLPWPHHSTTELGAKCEPVGTDLSEVTRNTTTPTLGTHSPREGKAKPLTISARSHRQPLVAVLPLMGKVRKQQPDDCNSGEAGLWGSQDRADTWTIELHGLTDRSLSSSLGPAGRHESE